MLYYLTASSLDIIFIVSSLIKKTLDLVSVFLFLFIIFVCGLRNFRIGRMRKQLDFILMNTLSCTRIHAQFAILLKFKHQKPILVCACARVICCWFYLMIPNQAILYIYTNQANLYKAANLTFVYDFGYSYPFHCVDKCI